MYVTICTDKSDKLVDIIVKLGKSGGCSSAQVECIASLLSTSIRGGIDPLELANVLVGVRCSEPLYQPGEDILSCGDAIGKYLLYHFSDKTYAPEANEPDEEEGTIFE